MLLHPSMVVTDFNSTAQVPILRPNSKVPLPGFTFPKTDGWKVQTGKMGTENTMKLSEVSIHKLTHIFKMRKFKAPTETEESWRSKLELESAEWEFKDTWRIKSFFVTPRDMMTWLKVQHRNLFTASLDQESDGKCSTGCGGRENQRHLVACHILRSQYWDHVLELIYRLGEPIPKDCELEAYLILGRVASGKAVHHAAAGILALAWRCLYAETTRAHVERKSLRLFAARRRLGSLLRTRVTAYGEKWLKWVHTGIHLEEPRVIPKKYHERGVIRQGWEGEYEIAPEIQEFAAKGTLEGKWYMPTRPDIETQMRKDQDEPQTGDSRPKKKKDREYGRGTPATQQTRREARRTDEFTDKSGDARTSAQVRGTACFSQCTLAAVRNLLRDEKIEPEYLANCQMRGIDRHTATGELEIRYVDWVRVLERIRQLGEKTIRLKPRLQNSEAMQDVIRGVAWKQIHVIAVLYDARLKGCVEIVPIFHTLGFPTTHGSVT